MWVVECQLAVNVKRVHSGQMGFAWIEPGVTVQKQRTPQMWNTAGKSLKLGSLFAALKNGIVALGAVLWDPIRARRTMRLNTVISSGRGWGISKQAGQPGTRSGVEPLEPRPARGGFFWDQLTAVSALASTRAG